MAYIGKQPVVGNFVKLDAITTSATATYNLLNGGVAYFPQTANNCIVSLNGVIQSPTSAYTISGSTIVFSDALTASDSIDFILVLGDVLSIGTPSDGTVTSAKLASGVSGLISWQSIVTASTLTAVASRGYWIDTSSNACTVTLPASAVNGDTIILADYARKWGTNAVTINTNSLNFQGNTTPNPVYNTSGQSVTLVYSGATLGWIPTVDDDVTLETGYSIDFLVIAGGAGGGGCASPTGGAGGGGAGGYRTSTQTSTAGTVITVTVGDGGAGGVSTGQVGASGSNSSISGSGLTTITSAGGGGGSFENASPTGGRNGGSGGGGSYVGSAGGLGNVPSTSPSQGNNGGTGMVPVPYRGGGGGGAGSSGVDGSSTGNGGSGSTSSITGSSVTRAGGGGGGCYAPDTAGTGQAGGGNGGSGAPGSNATANTGSGGGGASSDGGNRAGGNGGKGIVILSVLTSLYSGTSTGSPTITTSGSNTILQFTGSGSYTV
jgi:hypothetical protein